MNKLKDFMSFDPIYCTAEMTLKNAAKLMSKHNCGILPVVESESNKKVKGIISDRDLFSRSLARGLNPLELTVGDCMTTPAITINFGEKLSSVSQAMIQHKLIRLPVIDKNKELCGIISLGDLVEAKEFAAIFLILKSVMSSYRLA